MTEREKIFFLLGISLTISIIAILSDIGHCATVHRLPPARFSFAKLSEPVKIKALTDLESHIVKADYYKIPGFKITNEGIYHSEWLRPTEFVAIINVVSDLLQGDEVSIRWNKDTGSLYLDGEGIHAIINPHLVHRRIKEIAPSILRHSVIDLLEAFQQ